MVFTDPPYNVDYEGYTKDKLTIQGYRMSGDEFRRFLESVFANYGRIVQRGASCTSAMPCRFSGNFRQRSKQLALHCRLVWRFGLNADCLRTPRTVHASRESGVQHVSFDAPRGTRAGDILLADSTILSTLFGGDQSLENFWKNIATK